MPIAPMSPVNRRTFPIVSVVTSPSQAIVPKDVSFVSGLTGDGRGLSEDLSSLLRHELDEPMHEPDHNHEAHRATEHALNEALAQERQKQQLLEHDAQARHEAILVVQIDRTYAVEMQAQEREALLINHVQSRDDLLHSEERERERLNELKHQEALEFERAEFPTSGC